MWGVSVAFLTSTYVDDVMRLQLVEDAAEHRRAVAEMKRNFAAAEEALRMLVVIAIS